MFLSLVLQDYRIPVSCSATGNDRDCRKAIALGFLYLNQSPG